jgi:large subunit ribosomal protein L21
LDLGALCTSTRARLLAFGFLWDARLRQSARDPRTSEESESVLPMVYAIVRAGGRQEKVSVGDVLEIDRVQAAPGDSVDLPVLLLVDGTDVTSDKAALAKATVTVEVVAATKGPKINILKYKNKTGYRKRQGHRQHHTRVLVTGIETGAKAAEKPAAETDQATTVSATADAE